MTDRQPSRTEPPPPALGDAPAVEAFLRAQVAPRFGALVADARQRRDTAPSAVADLCTARGSIAWEVEGDGAGPWYLNIAEGAMVVAATPLEPPFMAVVQSQRDWQRFVSGTASAGVLGSSGAHRTLGKARIDRLRPIRGAVRFVITGLPDGGEWAFVTRFGPGPFAPEPQTTVTLSAAVMQQMQRGELNPQLAFMKGQVKLAGDVGLAMQVGTALLL